MVDLKDLQHVETYTEERVVSISEKVGAHLYDKVDCAQFKFSLSTSTNPPWREKFDEAIASNREIDEKLAPYPFQEGHSNKRIHIHGGDIDLTCKPNEIQYLLSVVKMAMVSANREYEVYRQEQLRIAAQKMEEKENATAEKAAKEKSLQDMGSEVQRYGIVR